MKNTTTLLLLFTISYLTANKATVYGHIKDSKTNEHLPNMIVLVKDLGLETTSDEKGHFKIENISGGTHTIAVRGLGYTPTETIITIRKDSINNVTIEMFEDLVSLNQIVVSSNRTETSRREASNIVNIITPKLFETTNSVCLAQGLNYQPGLRVETTCQNCGFQQVRINGLDGPYSQILIDSRPIFSALAGVYGIEQIPTNMIERVEVVRGGGSALFGSNAIAGTINIITKEPLKNTATLSNQTTFIGGSSADINTSLNAALISDNHNAGLSLYASSRQREAYDANKDGFTEIGILEGLNVGFRGYYKPGRLTKLTMEYHNMGEFRRGGNNLDLPAHQSDITEQTEHNINSGGIKYDIMTEDNKNRINIFSSAQSIARKSYYGAQQDLNAYGTTKDISAVTGAQYIHKFEKVIFIPSDLTIGTEYNYNSMADKQLGYNRQIDQLVYTYSGYFQNEWKTTKWSILAGGRFDKHNLIKKTIFSPRLNLRYNPSELINLRANYGSGFRAPQAFDEDMHITAVNGSVQMIKLDPNLKPERSNSFSVSGDFNKRFGNVQTNILVEGFYTDLANVFVLEETGTDTDGTMVLMRRNGLGAIVRGINFEGKVASGSKLQFQFGATFQKSLYKEKEQWTNEINVKPQREMFRTPNQYSYFTLNYNPIKKMTLSISGTHTGSMYIQHFAGDIPEDTLEKTSNFFDINIRLAHEFSISKNTKLQLNSGILNIINSYQNDFDTGEFRDSGYVYGPSLPRSFIIGCKLIL